MAYLPHYRVRVSGTFAATTANPYEIWSWGFNYGSPVAPFPFTEPPDAAWATPMISKIVDFHVSGGAKIATQCRLTEIKISAVNADGHVAVGEDGNYLQVVESPSPEDFSGGGGALAHPTQVALCVSLQTARAGRHGRGRFYLPGPVIGLATDGLITVGNRDTVANAVQGFVNDLNTLDADFSVIVAGSDAHNSVVTNIRVGRALDTQRRRRNALTEDYLALPITA